MESTYSFLKTLKKVGESAVEIGGAIIIAVSPQIVDIILEYASNTPPETIHIPAQYATLWFLVIRGFSNYWKNRKKA